MLKEKFKKPKALILYCLSIDVIGASSEIPPYGGNQGEWDDVD